MQFMLANCSFHAWGIWYVKFCCADVLKGYICVGGLHDGGMTRYVFRFETMQGDF